MRLSCVISPAFVALVSGCSLDHGDQNLVQPHPSDGAVDGTVAEGGSDAGRDGSKSDGTPGFDGPPPIEDALVEDFGTGPAKGEHVEALIGPAGGTLSGAD